MAEWHKTACILCSLNCGLEVQTENGRITKVKGVIGSSQRQGVVAKRDLVAGDTINLENVRFAWPSFGIPVELWDLVDGWQLAGPVSANRPIEWKHVKQGPA